MEKRTDVKTLGLHKWRILLIVAYRWWCFRGCSWGFSNWCPLNPSNWRFSNDALNLVNWSSASPSWKNNSCILFYSLIRDNFYYSCIYVSSTFQPFLLILWTSFLAARTSTSVPPLYIVTTKCIKTTSIDCTDVNSAVHRVIPWPPI